MRKCPICGGAETCPQGDVIRTVSKADILEIGAKERVPEGYQVTHWTKRSSLAVPIWATIVGTAQSDRVIAHNPNLRKVWIGQCTYAFLREDET